MHLIDKALRAVRVSFLAALVMSPVTLAAQSASFTLAGAEVVPGEELSVLLSVGLDQPIRGFQLGVEFPPSQVTFQGASLDGTVLEKKVFDVYGIDTGPGFATLKAILPSSPAAGAAIPAGTAVPLLELRFRVTEGQDPGTHIPLALKSGLGFPAVPALVYVADRTLPPLSLGSATLLVSDKNVLRTKDLLALKLDEVRALEFSAYNLQPLMGFSIGVKFNPTVFRFLLADVKGTISEAVGAEYIMPIIDNTAGTFILGVLLDSAPPFGHQLIPAAGMEMTVAQARIQVIRVPGPSEEATLRLQDGLGLPAIRNVFVIDNYSYEPVKRSGQVSFVAEGTFIRGDVNDDGVVDISDPVATGMFLFLKTLELDCWKKADSDDNGVVNLQDMVFTINYLFLAGDVFPEPFPERGLDPTADELPCPADSVVNPAQTG
jgi:hypothetical protein